MIPISDYLNNHFEASAARSVLEIGCGLGDILRRVDFPHREGLDNDSRTVRAATFLSMIRRDHGLWFREYSFPDPLVGRYDAVILVNWIHRVPPDELSAALERIASDHLEVGGVLIVDAVPTEEGSTRHSHDMAALAHALGRRAVAIADDQLGRVVFSLEEIESSDATTDQPVGGVAPIDEG